MNGRALAMTAGMLWILSTTASEAQVPPPAPASPTIWSFLGIPQGMYKLHGHLVNRRGNRPRLEKKPPLKALADEANLKSDVPAIKAAAEIKKAEDLKPQKIKAIRYLATIGCGCYDKDGAVTKALLAAMDDCTEEVRLEAVRAISVAASSEYCVHCKQRSCCNEDIVAALSKIAYDRDDQGCFVESSERVRAAAIEAMGICCAGRGEPIVAEPVPTLDIEGAPAQPQIEGAPEGAPVERLDRDEPPAPVADPDAMTRNQAVEVPIETPPARIPLTKLTSSRRRATGSESTETLAPRQMEQDVSVLRTNEARQAPQELPVEAPESAGPSVPPVFKKVTGTITRVNQNLGIVELELHNQATLPHRTTVKIFHHAPEGAQMSAVLKIIESTPGTAIARVVENSRVHKLSVGESIELWK